LFIFLCSCSQGNYYESHVNHQLLPAKTYFPCNMDPNQWTRGADSWFLTGEPNSVERYAQSAPSRQAMTISAVKVPSFTKLDVEGSFQVQINGNQDQNSVYILGPNDALRQIAINVDHQTLSIKQDPASKTKFTNVIIRVGMNYLEQIDYAGCSKISGRNILSRNLALHSHGTDNIFLEGSLHVKEITQDGSGKIVLLGVYGTCSSVCVKNTGSVNLAGSIGIHDIKNTQGGTVRIVGAHSNNLTINNEGKSLTALTGNVNLKNVTAKDQSIVFIHGVNAGYINVSETDNAYVDLTGRTVNLNIETADTAQFEGRYLFTRHLYVKATGSSHVNARASDKAFIYASGNSSVYFFGPASIMSANTYGNAAVFPLFRERHWPTVNYK
jgi:hypothetical protein